jgi:sec-independent protein translocase protein TatC
LFGRKRAKARVRTPDDKASLVDHLRELRDRVIKSMIALAIGGIVVFLFYNHVLDWLRGPYADVCAKNPKFGCTGDFLITDPLDGFATRLRISGYGGFVVALPVILWQVWRFVAPGLHKNERRYAIPFVISSMFLFLFGAAVAWFTLPFALQFLVAFSGSGVTAAFNPGRYVRLVTLMIVAFGLGFLFPVVLVFLQLVGILTPQKLSSWRRMAIVVIFIAAAVITPSGDPYSLLAMAIPMYVFYECSILVGWVVQRRQTKRAAASPSAPSAA